MSLTTLVQLIFTGLVVTWIIRAIFIVVVLSIGLYYYRQHLKN
ncbi:hypothetical protein [Lactiplantibacillus fabifermentans]|uniref:Uncharacterized protein n=1 Tax=Lactiplantibacillus fabifermentans T30PCM01 TaxID=1400520 RepID=W6T8P2_9LACO|nr:hypothetical protein [Lactiplantibacillus fabifermentans]ETY74749.1 hypothetical protein LFAB_05650 [Lactiplantibacillus fabifermentans T30PCM01]